MNERRNRGSFTVYADWHPEGMPTVSKPGNEANYYRVETYYGSDCSIHFTAQQLRALREEITKALGESPQDISQLEEVACLLATVDGATASISRILWPAVPAVRE